MSPNFENRKARILEALTVPEDEYTDLSPKGSVDEGIRDLIDEINAITTLVTTSSCAGRISVFQEGQKKSLESSGDEVEGAIAGPGGKGGGRWLYVSHDPVEIPSEVSSGHYIRGLYGLKPALAESPSVVAGSLQLVHFKFEAMILHMLTASLEDASKVLTAASTSGFRESGAMGLTPSKDGSFSPMVAVRCNGLALDSIIGYVDKSGEARSLVSEEHLLLLTAIANERFKVNQERIKRFKSAIEAAFKPSETNGKFPNGNWEDADARRVRKRAEGLAKQQALRSAPPQEPSTAEQMIESLQFPD